MTTVEHNHAAEAADRQTVVAAGAVKHPHVIAAIAAAMAEMPGIGKNQQMSSSSGTYAYRSVEDITKVVQHLMGRHGIVPSPRVVNSSVAEISLGGKAWTVDRLEVIYRLYGPGGLEDYIEQGPFVAYARDNADRGSLKCMTQALKQMLLQTFVIGDGRDDPDSYEARDRDQASAPVDPAMALRRDLGRRIHELSPQARNHLRQHCEANDIPRVVSQLSDEQVEAVVVFLDDLELAEQQGALSGPESLADPETGEIPPEAPSGAPGTEEEAPTATSEPAPSLLADPMPLVDDNGYRDTLDEYLGTHGVDELIKTLDLLAQTGVVKALADRGATPTIGQDPDTLRRWLGALLIRNHAVDRQRLHGPDQVSINLDEGERAEQRTPKRRRTAEESERAPDETG